LNPRKSKPGKNGGIEVPDAQKKYRADDYFKKILRKNSPIQKYN